MAGRGIPTTEEGWYTRLKNMPQYSHLSEEQLWQLAKEKLAGTEEKEKEKKNAPPLVVQFDLDEFVESDPILKKKFFKLWQSIYKDLEGPDSVREIQAKQYAFACLLYQRRMIEDWQKGKIGGAILERYQMVVARWGEQLQQAPKHRKPGKGQEETISDAVSALEKAKTLQIHSDELIIEDQQLMESSPDDGPENP